MTIKVHGGLFSTATTRVLACLNEKDLDHEFVQIDMRAGEHQNVPFILLSPFGQVPAFEDGDLKLFESRAMTRYITQNYANKGTQLVFDDPKKMAIVNVGLEVESLRYDPLASRLTKELCVNPLLGIVTDDAIVKDLEAQLAKVLDLYEAGLAQSKYLCGDTFTLADLHHLPTLDGLMKTQVKALFDERPHVRAWCANILARPAWLKVVAMSKNNHLFN